MAALQALTGGLQPPNEDVEFLQQVGIFPTTTVQSAGDKINVDTGTTETGVLQAIQQLDTKLTNGFAQIMAKLSNTPMNGGAEINSKQSLEMSSPATAASPPVAPAQPSFFNRITGAASNAASKIKNSASSMFGSTAAPAATASAAEPAQAMPTSTTGVAVLKGGKNRSKSNKNKVPSTSSTNNPMEHIQTMSSTSSTGGGRRKKKSRRARKSRQRGSRRH